MLGGVWFSVVLASAGEPCVVKTASIVELADRDLHIGDVVELACVRATDRERLSSLAIAELPASSQGVELTHRAIRSLVERRAPGLEILAVGHDDDVVRIVRPSISATPPNLTCQIARRNLVAGQTIAADDLMPAACTPLAPGASPVAFDKVHHVVRATRQIDEGEPLGRLSAASRVFDAGDILSVAISIGPVRIERSVEAVQPSAASGRIFVSDSDGAIFSVPTLSALEGNE